MKKTIFTILICCIIVLGLIGYGKKDQENDNDKKFDFYISKLEIYNNIKFNDYFTFSDRRIYLAGNIEQFYVVDGKTMILKEYIADANRTMDDSIKSITKYLNRIDILKDGGTIIYKSKAKDMTMIVCNTLDKNKDIYIGDYSTGYEDFMCK